MRERKTVRAGIVGSGFAAKLHIDAMARVHGTLVDVVGVHSPTAANAERFAAAHGVPAVADLEALIDAADVVHVCAPPAAHEPVAAAALAAGRHAIVEKPLTGAFDPSDPRAMHDAALASVARMREAEAASAGRIHYAENWVYAPAIQKEREIVEKTGAQILWMHGEEAHSGSHSPAYGIWALAGGGSLIGKACHPLTAALYLKRIEGRARDGVPIRPAAVSARTHEITRLAAYRDAGHLRTDYRDVEDFGALHVVFADGTIADIFASEIVMGGIHNWLDVLVSNISILQMSWDDSRDDSAVSKGGIGQDTHKPDTGAAVDQPNSFRRHQASQGLGLFDMNLLMSDIAGQVDANLFHAIGAFRIAKFGVVSVWLSRSQNRIYCPARQR